MRADLVRGRRAKANGFGVCAGAAFCDVGLGQHDLLGWTEKANPQVLDLYLFSFDSSLRVQIAFLMGQAYALWPWFFGLFGLAPFDGHVHLCCSPLYHTAVLNFATISVQLGHPVVLMDGLDPESMLALIERHRVTHTHMVPTQFRRLLALPAQVRSAYDVAPCAPRSTAPRRARRKSSGG